MGFYGYEISEKDVYLFIEYCPNGTLTDMIKKGIDEEKVLDLFRQLVQGMCYMNAKGTFSITQPKCIEILNLTTY